MTSSLSPETPNSRDATKAFADIWESHQDQIKHAPSPEAVAIVEHATHDVVKAEFLAYFTGRPLPTRSIEIDTLS
ncbi:MAG: hypothetical protein ABIR37_03865 [Candidatus Saccharimonadales bacterium]